MCIRDSRYGAMEQVRENVQTRVDTSEAGEGVAYSSVSSPLKSMAPVKDQNAVIVPSARLAQPYSPWKQNVYLVENDRRALERDLRRTKSRMEGDLKAVLEQSRRGREARNALLSKEQVIEADMSKLADSIAEDQRERESIDSSREELKAKLAALKVQVSSHCRDLFDNLQEEKDTRNELVDSYCDVASHLKEIKHGYLDLHKDLEPNPIERNELEGMSKLRVQVEVMKELNTLDLGKSASASLPSPKSPLIALSASARSPQVQLEAAAPQVAALPPAQQSELTKGVLREMRSVFDSMDMSHHGVVGRRALALQVNKHEGLNDLFAKSASGNGIGSLCARLLPESDPEGSISWQQFVTDMGESLCVQEKVLA
eukprot:TRINITY_DN18445_c0_g1_i1.p1 TRINITY_DN18445_c0_g1~~TRINITY_DN18445_c0_g1_i1.p1  ORF type:complete len:372 (+),score=82.15 TRINITY_DN18445_c0_g1_i1:164-1279(+)